MAVETKRKRISKLTYMVIFFVLIVAGFVSTHLYFSHKEKNKLDETLQSIPVFQTAHQYEPERYSQIKDRAAVLKNERKPIEQLMSYALKESAERLSSRISYISDENMIKLTDIILDDLNYLKNQGEASCFHYLLLNKNTKTHFERILPETRLQKTLDAYNTILVSSYQINTPFENDSEETIYDLSMVFDKLSTVYGSDLAQLERIENEDINREQVCQMTIDLYTEIRQLPDERAAPLLRAFLGSK